MSDEFDHASFPVINLLHGQEACESRLELRYSRRDLSSVASLVRVACLLDGSLLAMLSHVDGVYCRASRSLCSRNKVRVIFHSINYSQERQCTCSIPRALAFLADAGDDVRRRIAKTLRR